MPKFCKNLKNTGDGFTKTSNFAKIKKIKNLLLEENSMENLQFQPIQIVI